MAYKVDRGRTRAGVRAVAQLVGELAELLDVAVELVRPKDGRAALVPLLLVLFERDRVVGVAIGEAGDHHHLRGTARPSGGGGCEYVHGGGKGEAGVNRAGIGEVRRESARARAQDSALLLSKMKAAREVAQSVAVTQHNGKITVPGVW